MVIVLFILLLVVLLQMLIVKKMLVVIRQLKIKIELLTQIIEMDGKKNEKTN